jgi:peptidoglycan/xylan/chitin deacetylase (PgdA/CDA1 family)
VTNLRRLLRWLWASMLAATGCHWWARRQLCRMGGIVLLTFHRVVGDADLAFSHSLPGMVIRAQTFRELVAYVVSHCEAVDLRRAEPGIASSKLRVAFTFDDGWLDNYTVVFPIIRKYLAPITIFICPGLLDQPAPFWPERVVALARAVRPVIKDAEIEVLVENLKRSTQHDREAYLAKLSEQVTKEGKSVVLSRVDSTLDWTAIAEMAQEGVSVGSHTQTHQILPFILLETAREEVFESKTAIERTLKSSCEMFAYPNGNWSLDTRRILLAAGFNLAVTTERGAWTADSDRLAVPRTNVAEDDIVGPRGRFSPSMFEYAIFWAVWRATIARLRASVSERCQPANV